MIAARTRALLVLSLLMSTAFSSGAARSAQAAATRDLRDIEYSRVGSLHLSLDASLPDVAAGPTPAVIIVHGGGWVRGDRRVDVQPLFAPLSQAGFAWFSIDYRLATDMMQFGVAVEDVATAIDFVKAHATEYNIDPNRIALVGESAGGQLAAMAVLRSQNAHLVKAFVGIYTPTDLLALYKNSTFIPPQIRDNVRGTPWESMVLAGLKQLSPVDNLRPDMPPFLLIHGTADPLVPFAQSTVMCDRMHALRASCEVYPVEGAGHGIRWWDHSSPRSTDYLRKMVAWLTQRLA